MISKICIEEIEVTVETLITFPKFQLHSQTVENNVKIVTGVTSSVYRGENRRKFNSILASQKARKSCDLKKYFTMVL